MKELTPIVLFAFNRPDKLALLLERVTQQENRKIYVFCDGARHAKESALCHETQRVAQGHTERALVKVCVRPYNYGLSSNLLDGISAVLATHPQAIIFEDDVHPKPGCIDFLEHALEVYEPRQEIFSIGCYHRPLPLNDYPDNVLLSPRFNCWGWAIWASRWNTIKDALERDAIPFRYYHDVPEIAGADIPSRLRHHHLKRNGLTWDTRVALHCLKNKWWQVQPRDVLIENVGFDGTGTHCEAGNCREVFDGHYDRTHYEVFNPQIEPSAALSRAIEISYADRGVGSFRRWRRKWLYRFRLFLMPPKPQS